MKLFTAALALERRVPTYRLTTRLVHAPSGDLILVGGGDPSLSARNYPYQKRRPGNQSAARDRGMADQVVAAGITRVDGDIVGDDQLYPWAPYPPSWTVDDINQEDGAPVSALTLNDNAITLAIRPAARAGDLAAVSFEPAIEYYAVDNRVLTVAGEKEARIRLTHMPGSRQLVMWGTIPLAGGTARETVAVDDPALFATCALYDALARRGVAIRGRPVARHRAITDDPWPVDGDVIATRLSPPMVEMLQVIEKVSQNLHTELMLREVARVTRGAGTRESGLQELAAWLTSIGIKTEEWRAEDGSGLSRNDQVSPRAVTRLLSYMAASKNGAAWVSLLPVGGEDGTLANRLCWVSDATAAKRVRAKDRKLVAGGRTFRLRRQPHPRTAGLFDSGQQLCRASGRGRAWVDKLALALVE